MTTVRDVVSLIVPYVTFSIRDEDNKEYFYVSPVFEAPTYATDEVVKSKYADCKVIKIKVLTHCLILYINPSEKKGSCYE